MFSKLSYAKHRAQANKDHVKIIIETADDIIPTDDTEEDGDTEISLDELDEVIDSDADTITDEELTDLDAKVGEIADKGDVDIATMTRDEIEQHVDSAGPLSIAELNA